MTKNEDIKMMFHLHETLMAQNPNKLTFSKNQDKESSEARSHERRID